MTTIPDLLQAATRDAHRALLVVRNISHVQLLSIARQWQAPFLAAHDSADRADRITGLLGREFDFLVHQSSSSMDVDLLSALSGTLRAGGLLLLGFPELDEPEHAGSRARNAGGRFASRFFRLLEQAQAQHPDKICIIERLSASENPITTPIPTPITSLGSDTVSAWAALSADRQNEAATAPNPAAVDEQESLLLQACDHLKHHSRACIIISGRRGRGKSSLLGRMAAWLQQQGESPLVTTARRDALHSLQLQVDGVSVLAPEQAARSSAGHVLLVEEAASLPLALLEQYRQRFRQIIYCTTLEGHEQAGRAFAIRFIQTLQGDGRPLLHLTPVQAWRWAEDDPLEQWLDSVLLNAPCGPGLPGQTTHPTIDAGQAIAAASIVQQACLHDAGLDLATDTATPVLRRLCRDELASDEWLLHQVFALLRDSHYQTRSADLAHMLDAPALQIWILEQRQHIQGALLLAMEGPIPTSVHEAVLKRQRRLSHQLLPQLLTQCCNDSGPLNHRFARVLRIAVQPGRRREGLGSRLLQELVSRLTRQQPAPSAIGASCAGDRQNIAFWQTNGFLQFHTGFRRNPRTGAPAVAFLRLLDDCLETSSEGSQQTVLKDCLETAVHLHADNRQWLQDPANGSLQDHNDAALLSRFAAGQRSLTDTWAALCRLDRHQPLPLQKPEHVSQKQYESRLRQAVASRRSL